MPRNPKIEFDKLQMYCRKPYVIDLEDIPGKITVYVPTIGDMIEIGEKEFNQTVNVFICNTTQYRLVLWKMTPRIDWNEISDFHLFIMLMSQINPKVAKLFFGDLDFTKFTPLMKQIDEDTEPELILWNAEDEIEINYDVWNHFHQYIQNMFNTFPEEKNTKSQLMKEMFINSDERELANREWKEKQGKLPDNSLQAVISACINHPGFKYKLAELDEIGICEFYDSVKRLQIYEQSTALMKGMYSGFIDGKSINPESYNFMRS